MALPVPAAACPSQQRPPRFRFGGPFHQVRLGGEPACGFYVALDPHGIIVTDGGESLWPVGR